MTFEQLACRGVFQNMGQVLRLLSFTGTKVQILTQLAPQPLVLSLLAFTGTKVQILTQPAPQNCAGPERFLVYEKVYEDFCQRVTKIVKRMKQGVTLSSSQVQKKEKKKKYRKLVKRMKPGGRCRPRRWLTKIVNDKSMLQERLKKIKKYVALWSSQVDFGAVRLRTSKAALTKAVLVHQH